MIFIFGFCIIVESIVFLFLLLKIMMVFFVISGVKIDVIVRLKEMDEYKGKLVFLLFI